MGTLAEKLDYLADTKEAIKQALIDRGCTISDSDTFRSYVNKLSELPSLPISITAVYTQTVTVKDTDSLDVLRPDLVVTAYYGDGTAKVVTDYTLSGTLEVGTSTITASYKGFSDTFEVTVEESIIQLYNWDFTQSLTDSVQGVTASIIQGVTHAIGTGLIFASRVSSVYLADGLMDIGRTAEIDISAMNLATGGTPGVFTTTNNYGFRYNDNGGYKYWEVARYSGSATPTYHASDANIFNGKTLKMTIISDSLMEVYADDTLVYSGGRVDIGASMPWGLGGITNKTTAWGNSYRDMTITGVRIYANQ